MFFPCFWVFKDDGGSTQNPCIGKHHSKGLWKGEWGKFVFDYWYQRGQRRTGSLRLETPAHQKGEAVWGLSRLQDAQKGWAGVSLGVNHPLRGASIWSTKNQQGRRAKGKENIGIALPHSYWKFSAGWPWCLWRDPQWEQERISPAEGVWNEGDDRTLGIRTGFAIDFNGIIIDS